MPRPKPATYDGFVDKEACDPQDPTGPPRESEPVEPEPSPSFKPAFGMIVLYCGNGSKVSPAIILEVENSDINSDFEDRCKLGVFGDERTGYLVLTAPRSAPGDPYAWSPLP